MQILLAIIVALPVLFIAARYLVQNVSPMPDNLGVTDGQLAACPNSPNCVSTQAPATDSHYMEPIPYEGNTADTRDALIAIMDDMDRSTIITTRPDYIHAEFRSMLWGFVDDVEIYLDEDNGLIHFRSAARLGQGDMGVNRRRMQTIRQQLMARLTAAETPTQVSA